MKSAKKTGTVGKCAFCGCKIVYTNHNQLYCSRKCAVKAQNKRKSDLRMVPVNAGIRDSPSDRKYSRMSEEESIKEVRALFNLKPITRGRLLCKKCGKPFCSDDIDRERMCYDCRIASSNDLSMVYAGLSYKRNGHTIAVSCE